MILGGEPHIRVANRAYPIGRGRWVVPRDDALARSFQVVGGLADRERLVEARDLQRLHDLLVG